MLLLHSISYYWLAFLADLGLWRFTDSHFYCQFSTPSPFSGRKMCGALRMVSIISYLCCYVILSMHLLFILLWAVMGRGLVDIIAIEGEMRNCLKTILVVLLILSL
jgi:hypothetical protein